MQERPNLQPKPESGSDNDTSNIAKAILQRLENYPDEQMLAVERKHTLYEPTIKSAGEMRTEIKKLLEDPLTEPWQIPAYSVLTENPEPGFLEKLASEKRLKEVEEAVTMSLEALEGLPDDQIVAAGRGLMDNSPLVESVKTLKEQLIDLSKTPGIDPLDIPLYILLDNNPTPDFLEKYREKMKKKDEENRQTEEYLREHLLEELEEYDDDQVLVIQAYTDPPFTLRVDMLKQALRENWDPAWYASYAEKKPFDHRDLIHLHILSDDADNYFEDFKEKLANWKRKFMKKLEGHSDNEIVWIHEGHMIKGSVYKTLVGDLKKTINERTTDYAFDEGDVIRVIGFGNNFSVNEYNKSVNDKRMKQLHHIADYVNTNFAAKARLQEFEEYEKVKLTYDYETNPETVEMSVGELRDILNDRSLLSRAFAITKDDKIIALFNPPEYEKPEGA